MKRLSAGWWLVVGGCWFVVCLVAANTVAAQQAPAAQPSRPNIVWISNEDMSPHLGVYGDPLARTPVLDRLAAESIRYTNAFTTAPVCAPSRAAIITGMYQTTIGAQHMRTTEDRVPELPGPYLAVPPFYVKAFPEYLRAAGYLHEQSRKDRLSVRCAVYDLGRPRPSRALAEPPGQKPAVLLSVQPRGDAREPDFSDESRAEREAPRHRSVEGRRAAVLSRHASGSRRARAHVRQHRRHGCSGWRDSQAARGRRARRQHHRVLLERSRRRRAAFEALALRFGTARPAHDPVAEDVGCSGRLGQRSARQHDRSGADGAGARGRRDSGASTGSGPRRAQSAGPRRSSSSPRATGWTSNTT